MNRRDRNEAGKLFIGGLSWNTNQDTLLNYFSQYGEVCDCVVMKNQATGKSRGFGFVTFKDPNCVDTVLAVDMHNIDGRNVDAKACNPKGMNRAAGGNRGPREGGRMGGGSDPDKNKKIFIGGLPNVDEEALKSAFSVYGPVQDVTIMFDQVQKKSREEEKKKGKAGKSSVFHTTDTDGSMVGAKIPLGSLVECKKAEPRDGKGGGGPPGGPMMDNGMNMSLQQQDGGDWSGNGWNMPPGGPRGPYQDQFQQGFGGPGFQPPPQQPQGYNPGGGYSPAGYGQQPGAPQGGPPPQSAGQGYQQQAWNQQPGASPGQQGVWPPPPGQPSTPQGPPPPAQPVPAQAPQPLTNPVAYGGQPQQGYNQPGAPNSYGAQWGAVPPASQAQSPTVTQPPQPPAAQPGYGAYGQPPAAPGGAPYGAPGQPPTPQSPQTAAPPRPYGDYSATQPSAQAASTATPAYPGYSPYGTPQAPAAVPDPYAPPAPTGVPAQPGAAPGYGATPPAAGAPPTDPAAAQPKPADYSAYSYGAYGDATGGFAAIAPPAGAYPGQGDAGQQAYGAPPGAGGYQRAGAAGAQGYHPYRR